MKKNESWKRMVAGVLALTMVTGVAPFEGSGYFFQNDLVKVNAKEYSERYVNITDLQAGDIISESVSVLEYHSDSGSMDDGYTLTLKAGGYTDYSGSIADRDTTLHKDSNYFMESGYGLDGQYSPAYNGKSADSWQVESIDHEAKKLTLTGYSAPESDPEVLKGDNIEFYEYDSDSGVLVAAEKEAASCYKVNSGDRIWEDGSVYVVTENTTFEKRIVIEGSVKLILSDGVTLTAKQGIQVNEGSQFAVYAQSFGEKAGKLFAGTTDGTDTTIARNPENAAIGGNPRTVNGTISIHGGIINARSNAGAAAIGGGQDSILGTLNIYGGDVTASVDDPDYSASIGGGYREVGGTVNIYGGKLTAKNQNQDSRPTTWNVSEDAVIMAGNNAESAEEVSEVGNQYYLCIDAGTVTGERETRKNLKSAVVTVDTANKKVTVTKDDDVVPPEEYTVKFGKDTETATEEFPTEYGTYYAFVSAKEGSENYTGSVKKSFVIAREIDGVKFDKEWTATDSLPTASGNYYLTGDVVLDDRPENSYDKNINIYLNDHSITYNGSGSLVVMNGVYNKSSGFYGGDSTEGNANKIMITNKGRLTYLSGEDQCLTLYKVTVECAGTGAALNGSTTGSKMVMKVGSKLVSTAGNNGDYWAVDCGNGYHLEMAGGEISGFKNAVASNSEGNAFLVTADSKIDGIIRVAKGNKIVFSNDSKLTGDHKMKFAKWLSGTGWVDFSPSEDFPYEFTDGATETEFVCAENGYSAVRNESNNWEALFTDYAISLPESGVITANSDRACENDTVVLAMKAGYALPEGILPVVMNGGKEVAVTANEDGTYSFTMPAGDVTVSVAEDSIAKAEYTITTGENVTSNLEKATVGNKVRLKINIPEKTEENSEKEPAKQAVKEFTVKCGDTVITDGLQKIDYDEYELTMPAGNVTVNVEFADIAEYTVFYFGDDVTEARITSYGLSDESKMEKDVELNGDTAWSMKAEAAEAEKMNIQFKNADGSWTEAKEVSVVTLTDTTTILGNLTDVPGGQCVIVKGDTNLVGVVFNQDEKESTSSKYKFAAKGEKVIAPSADERKGYVFQYWTDQKGNQFKAGAEIATADYDYEVISLNAEWKKSECKVSFAMNGAKEKIADQTVEVGKKAVKPIDPTKEGHAFVKWVVAENSGAYTKGETFDFDKELTGDVTLKAEWKHVHSYGYYTLDAPVFDGAFKDYCTEKYLSAIHVKMCSKWDDYAVEAHQFDKNGKCACGYQKKVEKVKVTIWGNTVEQKQIEKNTAVQLSAPEKDGNKVFWCWGYSYDGSSYKVLCEARNVSVTVPCDLHLHPFYKDPPEEPKPEAKVSVTKTTQGLSFLMQYTLPEGCKATDCVIKVGNNYRIHYFRPYVLSPKSNIVNSFTSLVGKGRDTNYHVFGNPSTWDVMAGKVTVYYDVNDNVIDKIGKAALRDKMYASKGVTVGNTELLVKKASSLGRSGGVYFNLTPSSNTEINYAMGYVNYIDKNGKAQVLKVDPIAATYVNPNLTK